MIPGPYFVYVLLQRRFMILTLKTELMVILYMRVQIFAMN